jgi:hypothetical protein
MKTIDARILNEAKMLARWKLGRALAEAERVQTVGPGALRVSGGRAPKGRSPEGHHACDETDV